MSVQVLKQSVIVSQTHRDESRETDIANTMRIPHRHLSQSASRHEAPHPCVGAGTGGPGTATEAALVALELATTPDPVADLVGDWAARGSPAFNVAVARCAGAGAGVATIDDLVVTDVRGVATFDDDVAGAEAVADGAAASEAFVVTPRSRSPMLGRSFICSPQYSGKESWKRFCFRFQS